MQLSPVRRVSSSGSGPGRTPEPIRCDTVKFVMLSTLGPDGSARMRENPARLEEVNADVESMGVKVLAQYAVLGQWDFLNILEAPDEIVMARVATTLAARGTLKTMTMPIIDVADYIAAMGNHI